MSVIRNKDVEGVMSVNACYGGTAALFNSIAYLQSDQGVNKYAIVIAADIAMYPPGPARPTGGVGAVAILLKRTHIPSITLQTHRASYFDHAYDFYKPNPLNYYPIVDGQLSIHSYLHSLNSTYNSLSQKLSAPISINQFDYLIFHTPYAKMVQKSFYSLYYQDIINNTIQIDPNLKAQLLAHPYNHQTTQALLHQHANTLFKTKTFPSLHFSRNMGNIYTGAIFGCLISLITDNNIDLKDKIILAFSYGSGSAASLFSLKVNTDLSEIKSKLECRQQLEQRIKVNPVEYSNIMQKLEENYQKPYLKQIDTSQMKLFDNTYYLHSVDNQFRRKYYLFNQQKNTNQDQNGQISTAIDRLNQINSILKQK